MGEVVPAEDAEVEEVPEVDEAGLIRALAVPVVLMLDLGEGIILPISFERIFVPIFSVKR